MIMIMIMIKLQSYSQFLAGTQQRQNE